MAAHGDLMGDVSEADQEAGLIASCSSLRASAGRCRRHTPTEGSMGRGDAVAHDPSVADYRDTSPRWRAGRSMIKTRSTTSS